MRDKTVYCVWCVAIIMIVIGTFRDFAKLNALEREVQDLRQYIHAGCQGRYQGAGEQP